MGDGADDRLRGGLLAVAALLAVTVGGWWWWANAPATGPERAASGAGATPRYIASFDPPDTLEEALAGSAGTAVRVRVDAETGRIIDATELPGEAAGVALPRFTDTLWRERLTLVPGGGPVRRESLADGARHLLQYRCTGDGELLISIVHGPSTDTSRTTCDGELGELELPDADVSGRLELSAVAPGPIEVEAQLVALP